MQRPQAASGRRSTAASLSSSVCGLSSTDAPVTVSASAAADRPPAVRSLRLAPSFHRRRQTTPAADQYCTRDDERQRRQCHRQPRRNALPAVRRRRGPSVSVSEAAAAVQLHCTFQPRPEAEAAANHPEQPAQSRSTNLSRHRTRPTASLFDDGKAAPQTAAAAAALRRDPPCLRAAGRSRRWRLISLLRANRGA